MIQGGKRRYNPRPLFSSLHFFAKFILHFLLQGHTLINDLQERNGIVFAFDITGHIFI